MSMLLLYFKYFVITYSIYNKWTHLEIFNTYEDIKICFKYFNLYNKFSYNNYESENS